MNKVVVIFILFSICGGVFSLSPCSDEKEIKSCFGTLFYCTSSVYTFDYVNESCPNGELLAEIRDAYLYQNISNEMAAQQGYDNDTTKKLQVNKKFLLRLLFLSIEI
jgi:hypothetical protein